MNNLLDVVMFGYILNCFVFIIAILFNIYMSLVGFNMNDIYKLRKNKQSTIKKIIFLIAPYYMAYRILRGIFILTSDKTNQEKADALYNQKGK